MLSGHTSHQIGLDADIWLTPMPDRILSPLEREDMEAVSMLKDPFTVDPAIFTLLQVKLIKRAATYPQVARIFVHPAIVALCQQASQAGKDTSWLGKVRPWWNHHYHFHIRLAASGRGRLRRSEAACRRQWLRPGAHQLVCHVEDGRDRDGSGPARRLVVEGKPPRAQLPKECGDVLKAGGFEPPIPKEGNDRASAGDPCRARHQGCRSARAGADPGSAQSADKAGEMTLPDRNPLR